MSGSVLAQAIPVAITPILTRLYSPKDFGVLALYTSVVAILGAIANGRYELAVMLPDTEEEAFNVMAVGSGIVTLFSVFLLIVFGVLNASIASLLGNADIAPWLYMMPVSVFFTGTYNLLNYYTNRKKLYKELAGASVVKSIAGGGVQLAGGAMAAGAGGLIIGQITSAASSIFRLYKRSMHGSGWTTSVSWDTMKKMVLRYQDFPKYSMPAILANSLNTNLLNILVSNLFSVATLGHYSLVNRVLGLPSTFVGNALSQVFFQRVTEEKRNTGIGIKAFDATVKNLALVSGPAFIVMYFIVEELFAVVFGEQWRIAGQYAKYLVPLFAVRMIVSPVSMLNDVFEKQRITLFWQLGLLCLGLTCIMFSVIQHWTFIDFIRLYGVVIALHYFLLGIILWMVSRGRI